MIVISENVTRHVDFIQHRLCSMDFSVDLLNTMEKKMTSELQKVVKAVNVSCTSEVNEFALMKLNKNTSRENCGKST